MIQYIQLKKYNTNNSLDVDTTFLVQSSQTIYHRRAGFAPWKNPLPPVAWNVVHPWLAKPDHKKLRSAKCRTQSCIVALAIILGWT
jgi:hypothetical protein